MGLRAISFCILDFLKGLKNGSESRRPGRAESAFPLGSTGHRGELKIDIWLARDYANLPVRLKITDKNGDVLDQVATGVDLGARKAQ